MKYIRLPNGNKIEFYDYALTNGCIIKFVNADYTYIKDFFGTLVIPSIEILDEEEKVTEQIELNMIRKNIVIETGYIKEYEQKLISEEHDEIVLEPLIGEDGKHVINEDNEAQYVPKTVRFPATYETVSKDVEAEIITVILERPTAQEQITEVKNYLGMVDVLELDLNGWKDYKQNENKKALKEFLDNSYVEFKGKKYGVSEEDQNEMSLNYMQYQIAKTAGLEESLEWHAKHEKCETFTEEEFLTLSIMIRTFVYPYMNQMQVYKESIYDCKSISDVKSIVIEYKVGE